MPLGPNSSTGCRDGTEPQGWAAWRLGPSRLAELKRLLAVHLVPSECSLGGAGAAIGSVTNPRLKRVPSELL